MHRSSLRTWLLLVSVLFALLVVGGISLTTYIVVSESMTTVAELTTARLSRAAAEAVTLEITNALLEAGQAGLTGTERESKAREIMVEELPLLFGAQVLAEGEIAFYGPDTKPIWASSPAARIAGMAEHRRRALDQRVSVESSSGRGGLLEGLFAPADLGVYIVHVPVDMPAGQFGVMDVVYYPTREEQEIDHIRLPMLALAISAMLVMIVMMQTSMAWVLKLVEDLRKAADAVDAGDLNVRLPDEGEHEIGDLARSINNLIDRLRHRAEAQTRFVADASHELATPVAGIRGYTNILRAWGRDDPEVREEAVNAIDRESRRMARLTQDLLTLVRSERGLQFKPVRFDLNARSRQMLASTATRYIDKRLEFIGPDEGPLFMIGDPDRIEDAISILLDNAAKYTPEGGRVSLATRRRRDMVVVDVADTGPGIPERDLPSIFERFYRSDASRSQSTGGFGLGLAIAKSVIDAAGGTIEVVSHLGRGTTFTVRLPRGRS
ncbi:MAG: ATP-binding protein [Actinomycetota bacterium]|nr:ATP-binding protein [Actinomycetota bacterium]